MKALIISQDNFDEIINRLDKIENHLANVQNSHLVDRFVDNQEFIHLLKISKRTAQSFRDTGKITFSQIGNKIYYRMSDIQVFMDKYSKPSIANVS